MVATSKRVLPHKPSFNPLDFVSNLFAASGMCAYDPAKDDIPLPSGGFRPGQQLIFDG
jgi:hypothetical protein